MIYAAALKPKLVQSRGSVRDALLGDTLYRAVRMIPLSKIMGIKE